jgi:polyphenol oxidase
MIDLLQPGWAAPACVRAAFTLRAGGCSAAPYDSLNLGIHVGDDPGTVLENRRRVRAGLLLPGEPVWLDQVHGRGVIHVRAQPDPAAARPVADAAVTRVAGIVLAVQVADCLPVLFADRAGTVIAAAHAGWRGLAAGVLEATICAMALAPSEIVAWLGPAIGPGHFEVGAEVRDAFVAGEPGDAGCFTANPSGRWQCDLAGLARRRLGRLGVAQLDGGAWCTASDSQRFYSHRRDQRTGRMAALAWLAGAGKPGGEGVGDVRL